jgi:hypothetical protein
MYLVSSINYRTDLEYIKVNSWQVFSKQLKNYTVAHK